MADPDFLQTPPKTIIETERLRLRTVTLADVDALLPIITDEETMKFTSGVVPNDHDIAERWLSARALGRDVFNFVITRKDSSSQGDGDAGGGGGDAEVLVGIMGSYHWPEVGYLIHPAHTGQGYATEALRALTTAYFARVPSPSTSTSALGFDYMQAETDAANLASQAVLRKAGFELVEALPQAFESPMLGLRDTLIFRIARPGMTLRGLGLVERPVRSLERLGLARGVGGGGGGVVNGEGGGEEEDGFVPPMQ
ncbi:hypothetical protein Q7P37_006340 [Cladosporium fusiforme]